MGISFETDCPYCGCNEPVAIAQTGIIVTGLVPTGGGEFGGDVAPRHRLAYLEHLGYSKKETASWSGDRVERAIKRSQHREKNGLCSYKQAKKIEQFYPGRFSRAGREAMTKGEAGKLLGEKVKQFRQKARAS